MNQFNHLFPEMISLEAENGLAEGKPTKFMNISPFGVKTIACLALEDITGMNQRLLNKKSEEYRFQDRD
jgi:hypothetical protein